MILYWPGFAIFRIVALFYHLKVEGRENVPRKGPLIVVSNHNSRKDPVAINLALRRPVHYMAKKEAFDPKNGLFECLMVRLFGAFPVDREHPGPEVIHTTEELLNKGSCIGIFPEEHRYPDNHLHHFRDGAAYIAWKTGAPLLPIGITETKGKELKVKVGKPFQLPQLQGRPREILPQATKIIREKIAELLPSDWVID